jgi:hypothetical protein
MIKIEFLLLGFILLSASCSADAMPALTYTKGFCADSDGVNPYIKGNASMLYKDRAYLYLDSCSDERTIRDWFCYAGRLQTGIYTCPLNYKCRDGACFSENASTGLAPQPQNCLDLEGSGQVTTYLSGKELYILKDTCIDWYTVSKAYCKNTGNESFGEYKTMNCPEGLICSGGTCNIPMPAFPHQNATATTLPPVLRITRTLSNVESEGNNISVRLDAGVDASRSPCAFGLSERVPKGWDITNVSSGGVTGAYPGNGSIRLSAVVSALNAWCDGAGSLEDAVDVMQQWRRDGVSEGMIEWVFWDPSGRLHDLEAGYTVSIPYNASVNSYFYGDSTLDGVKYQKTSGNYMVITQRTVTTTTTTTTSFPVSRVSGIVYRAENKLPVPGASVSVNCSEKYGGYAENFADEHGYYTVEIICPFGSQAYVAASSPKEEICATPDDCIMYPEEKGNGSASITSPGYARIDVKVFPAS